MIKVKTQIANDKIEDTNLKLTNSWQLQPLDRNPKLPGADLLDSGSRWLLSKVWSSWQGCVISMKKITMFLKSLIFMIILTTGHQCLFCLPSKKSKVGVSAQWNFWLPTKGRAGRRGYKGGIKRIFSSATKMASKAADDRDKKTWKEARRRSCSPDICSEASIPYQLRCVL